VLLPVCYLGTWFWRAVLRRRLEAAVVQPDDWAHRYISFRRALRVLLVACAALLLATSLVAWVGKQACVFWQRSRCAPAAAARAVRIPDEAKQELRDIWRRIVEDPSSLPGLKARHWEILEECHRPTPSFVTMVQTSIQMQLRYQELFWEDAAVALATGLPYKSSERERLELDLVEEDLAGEELLASNDATIADIAAGEPVFLGGDTMMVVTAEEIEQTIAAAPARRAALDELLAPPDDVRVE
jgi:hypothetical protein